jgi:hypothetical protein
MSFESFIRASEAGRRMGRDWRSARINREAGQAFADAGGGESGWGAVGALAAKEGDLDLARSAEDRVYQTQERGAQTEQRERAAWERRQIVFNNVLTSLRSIPYEQRKARIAHIAPRLQREGFTPEMIAAYDPTDEKIAADLAASGQFSQYAEMKQDVAGRWIGVTRDGRIVPIEGAPPPPQVRTLAPDEVRDAGFRPGSVVQQGFDGAYDVVQAPPVFNPYSAGAREVNAPPLPPGYLRDPE